MTASRTVSVGTTATRLDTTSDSTNDAAVSSGGGNYGQSIILYNAGAATVYIGGSDVTTANGLPIAATSYGPAFDLNAKDGLWGRVASGTCDVRVLEIGL